MTEPTSAQDLFKGRHFDQEIIILCVRWYITFKLSFRDLVQMMAERGNDRTKKTLRSYTASRHYDDYVIADPSGNVDRRRGLRLWGAGRSGPRSPSNTACH